MHAEHLLSILTTDRPAFGTALRSNDPAIVELAAIAGYDWVSITLEHAPLTVRDIATLQRAADARGITTLVHLPDAYDHRVLALLDEGVGGVVASQVNEASELRALVRAARFPPLGERGAAGVVRSSDYGAKPYAQYVAEADASVAVGAVIETRAGVENASDILAVEGLTVAYIGLHDLAQSLGTPGEFKAPGVLEAIEHVVATARDHGVTVAVSEKGYSVRELLELGARMVITPAGEYAALLEAFRSHLQRAQAVAREVAPVAQADRD